MTSQAMPASRARGSFSRGLATQSRVVGALILRELHTRYGRENIGYLWLFGEPMILATVIGMLHIGGGHAHYLGDIQPLPFAVLGYTVFILFRGTVNRSEGGLEANAPLLYHQMVSVFDIAISRALLEFAGVFLTFTILLTILICLGLAEPPVRPLVLIAAWGLMFWYSLGHSLIITSLSYENRTVGRFVHPYSYFMVGLSGSFYQIGWLPPTFRTVLGWIPITSIFELARYGQFRATNLNYFHGFYLVSACAILTWIGMVEVRRVRSRIHLS